MKTPPKRGATGEPSEIARFACLRGTSPPYWASRLASCNAVGMFDVPPTDVSAEALHKIAARLGMHSTSWVALESVGTSNTIYTLGDAFVLKVPRQHQPTIAAAQHEVSAAVAAHAAGVQTPAVVLFDDTCTLLPVPYTVYERVAGVPLASLPVDVATVAPIWRALGQDLARLHVQVPRTASTSGMLADAAHEDPRPWLDDLEASGVVLATEASWLRSWLERVESTRFDAGGTSFCHGDVNAGNVVVTANGDTFLALVDWGGAMWCDAAYDFAVVSLAAVPYLLEGYGSVAAVPGEATAADRILWYHLTMAVWGLRWGPPRDRDWIAQRLQRLRDETQQFIERAARRSR